MTEVDLLCIACVHNRKNKTLAALRSILNQNLCSRLSMKIVILDDGSVDGTALAVKKIFPTVDIIYGDGNHFWAGGMRYLFDYLKIHFKFKYLIVFNDDIVLSKNALTSLISTSSQLQSDNITPHIVTGAF